MRKKAGMHRINEMAGPVGWTKMERSVWLGRLEGGRPHRNWTMIEYPVRPGAELESSVPTSAMNIGVAYDSQLTPRTALRVMGQFVSSGVPVKKVQVMVSGSIQLLGMDTIFIPFEYSSKEPTQVSGDIRLGTLLRSFSESGRVTAPCGESG